MTTKGLLIFAKNNEQFNYIKQAEVAATMAKHYLDVPVSLITIEEDYKDNTSDIWDKVIYLNDIDTLKMEVFREILTNRLEW